jgi:hypothetical protein
MMSRYMTRNENAVTGVTGVCDQRRTKSANLSNHLAIATGLWPYDTESSVMTVTARFSDSHVLCLIILDGPSLGPSMRRLLFPVHARTNRALRVRWSGALPLAGALRTTITSTLRQRNDRDSSNRRI